MQAMAPDLTQRYQRAGELSADLKEFLAAFAPGMMSLVADVTPANRLGRAYGWYTTAVYIAMTLATMAYAADFRITFRGLWYTLASFPLHVFALLSALTRGRARFVVTSKGEAHRSLRPVAPRVIFPDSYDSIRIGVVQRSEQHAVDHAENRRVRPDAQCQRENRDCSETGIVRQHPSPMAQVLP